MTRLVKFCGFVRPAEVDVALSLGVDAVGLNLVKRSPRVLADETQASLLADRCVDKTQIVWVVDSQAPVWLATLLARYPTSCVQRAEATWPWPPSLARERRWDVVRLQSEDDMNSACELIADILVCDAPGTLGGSGRLSNWRLAATLATKRRMLLAGGLDADNVAQAIAEVDPYGVDVSSGIESEPAKKDPAKMQAFLKAART